MNIDFDNIVAKQVDDKLILLSLKSGAFFELNAVAADMWFLAEQGKNKHEILEQIQQTYAVSVDELEQDYEHFVACLKEHELVEIT